MDRDFLQELFSEFGPVVLRRMFSGYGVSVEGTNFALVLRGSIYFRVDDQNRPQFADEGSKPFQYDARGKVVTINSYWQLPDRLYDDPEELAHWARGSLAAAERAAASKRARRPRAKPSKTDVTPAKKTIKKAVTKKVVKKAAKKAAKAAVKPRTSKDARKRTAKARR
ncbi:TfoX/Sxy family protein [Bradyrhizobium prioriisuperbiae]|uniref:TfoX/Sxy family protein n=1 Tax=Bradyrhizobium prioriisuperbiae TaxID=2854389 RepID=UPI0028E41D34|nr:TfoX/Sxy family protein [Bradyrhizobium prioritasuperba]